MSTWPRRSPRISTDPRVGHSEDPTTFSSVVLPEPFGPSRAHRSPRPTDQVMSSRSGMPSRTTDTCSSRITSVFMAAPD